MLRARAATVAQKPVGSDRLPDVSSVLAVCAHPDDESFGLGAVLAGFAQCGSTTGVLCLTHGEASTLGVAVDLGEVRAAELASAANELGVARVELLDYPDGGLAATDLADLTSVIRRRAVAEHADLLLVFDEGGITGHPDHERSTEAAVVVGADLGVPVLGWALHERVADSLRREFGAPFVGRTDDEVDLMVRVDRRRQHEAIARHASQATDNPVLVRRLELQGDVEALRWLGK